MGVNEQYGWSPFSQPRPRTAWAFETKMSGRILATEPDGTQHDIAPSDWGTLAGARLLVAMCRDLVAGPSNNQVVAELKATRNTAERRLEVLDRIVTLMALAGIAGPSPLNFADIPERLAQHFSRQPIAYGVFVEVPGEGWALQFPTYRTLSEAEVCGCRFNSTAQIEVRPLYA